MRFHQLRDRHLRIFKVCVRGMAALSILAASGAALRASDFVLTGKYVQNNVCRGDGTDMKALMVTITPDEIAYSGGDCAINNSTQEGKTITLHVSCKTRQGAVMAGDVSFTQREDNTISMVDQNRAYRAILNKCPGS
jgi:hypothetical protein